MSISKDDSRYNKQSWEDADFPILCETCLGDNPYLRMLKDKYGSACHICTRPYTTFKWCPGKGMRYKKTEVCQICAKLKNICQTCLLDLEYGLPVQVRDSVLNITDTLPRSDANREYYRQMLELQVSDKDPTALIGDMAGNARKVNETLLKLARKRPFYDRNRPHLCSFWIKGECKRGEECPYRHEMPNDPKDPLSNQNIRDRYYGVNDPVAQKLLSKAAKMPKVQPPTDKEITTICVSGIDEKVIVEKDLYDYFYQFGEIKKIKIMKKVHCAFIKFQTRKEAQLAVETSSSRLVIKDKKLKVMWAKGQLGEPKATDQQSTKSDENKDQHFPVPSYFKESNEKE